MSYIDGFVIAVPVAKREAFIAHAGTFDANGARRVMECWGDDVPDGKLTDLRRAVQAKDDEAVVFSWIEWPDKATRDAGMAKFMQDPRLQQSGEMPFDGQARVRRHDGDDENRHRRDRGCPARLKNVRSSRA